jgi:hypothetical protein
MLHLFKNVRTRLATGRLALDGDPKTAVIPRTRGSAELESKGIEIGTILVDHGSLDLLQDHLALWAFSLDCLLFHAPFCESEFGCAERPPAARTALGIDARSVHCIFPDGQVLS